MTDAENNPSNAASDQADTYHDQHSLIRAATSAERMSYVFIVVFGLVGLLILVFLYWFVSGRLQLLQFISYMIFALVPFLLGGFFWVASKMLTELVYIFMDIEDNTRLHKTSEGD